MRILIVEDEPKLALAVKQGLESSDHIVSIAPTGEEGFFLAQTQAFDLLILDIMLPGRSGLEIMANLRRLGHRVPVMLLTSMAEIDDRIRGLDAGADDYLGKPFAMSELQARVRALGRRNSPEPAGILKVDDLELDRLRHVASRAGKPLDLTAREFELLEYLMRQPDQVVSREALAREVWRETARYTPIDNLIDVHIARLRRKLSESAGPKLLHTVRGVGFVLRMDRPGTIRMKIGRLNRSVGARIAASYVVVLICAMVVFMAGTAVVLYLQMRAQLGHYAIQDVETVEGLMSFSPDGALKMSEDYHNHPESKRVLDRLLEVLSVPAGRVLYRNERLGTHSLGGAPAPGEGVGGYSEHSASLEDGTRVRMVSRRHVLDGRTILLRLAYSEDGIRASVEQMLAAAALMFPVMIAAAAFLGIRMSRRALAPVHQITLQAERITSSNLHERIPLNKTGDELDHLAEVFNQTMARLERSFQRLRQFTADASHELRTPLAAIRSIGEVGLDRDGTRDEYRDLIGSMLEEVNRLTRLVDDLLMIARADAGAIQLQCTGVDLATLTHSTVALLEPLADEKEQRIAFASTGKVPIHADPGILRQAIINVLHNAIKYSPARSVISVRVGEDATVTIEDAGPGIAPEHATRIFDRFYRIDQGRARDAGGFGLGLSIAQWAVQVHGGTIAVAGNTFRIALPRE